MASIPEAAVEAAARALRKKFNGYEVGRTWDSRDQRTTYRNDATAALEAAAPHMLAAAWDDAYAKGRDRGEWEAAPVTEEPRHTNPYRSQP